MGERIEELTFCKEASMENKSFFLFRNAKGEYRVVEAKTYESFRFQPGMVITARMRKKGCAGEEICELTHPVYKEGKEYLFRVVRTGSLTCHNEFLHFLVVADAMGTEYKLKVKDSSLFPVGELVLCRLENQAEGRLKFIVICNYLACSMVKKE